MDRKTEESPIPADDLLRHSLAFKGTSRQVFQDALSSVAAMSGDLYPPYFMDYKSVLLIEPSRDVENGRMSTAEAVGMDVLVSEYKALVSGISRYQWRELHEALRISSPTLLSVFEMVQGVRDFGNEIALVLEVRDRLKEGRGVPEKNQTGGFWKEKAWNDYQEALREDGLSIGRWTSKAMLIAIKQKAVDRIKKDHSGSCNKTDLDSRIRGAALARDLFLETVELASHHTSNALAKTTSTPEVAS